MTLSKLIIFCDNKILYDHKENNYSFEIKDLNPIQQSGPYLCIAEVSGHFIYALEIDPQDEILGIFMDPKSIDFVDLRNILGFLDKESFLLLSRASILKLWKNQNIYCSICGSKNTFNLAEGAFECSCNQLPKYPTISPCIITLIHDDDKILLGRSKYFPQNMYSTLAGFIEAGESAEEALVREVKEEVNVACLLYTSDAADE